MERHLTLIPHISINPHTINLYNEVCWDPAPPCRDHIDPTKEETRTNYDHLLTSSRSAEGKVSKIARRKITKAVDYLLFLANNKKAYNPASGKSYNFKIAFVTLTLPSPQQHSDNEVKQVFLNQLLIELKKKFNVRNYVWRAEKQKNSNIHFHLIVDKFIPYLELRQIWNRILEKKGYITRYAEAQREWHRSGFRVREDLLKNWPAKKQYEAYCRAKKENWSNPNSTDIHAVRKVYNLKAYVIKYLTKVDDDNGLDKSAENEQVKQQGRIWGCNYELSNVNGANLIVDQEIEEEVMRIVNNEKIHSYQADYFSVYYIDVSNLEKYNCRKLFQAFSSYIFEKFQVPLQTHIFT